MSRAYYGPAGAGQPRPVARDQWPFKEFGDLGEALLRARAAVDKNLAVIAIGGDDGTQLGRGAIAASLRQVLAA
jgi:hypothetical protein